MTTNDAANVVIGANGALWVGETDVTAPSDVSTDMESVDSGWQDLGFVSEAGANFTDTKTVLEVMAWQSLFVIARRITARNLELAFAAREWNGNTVRLAFGGGDITDLGGGEFSYSPPDPEDIDERSMVLEWQDGDKHYRLYVPVGMVTSNTQTTLARTAPSDLPITFSATNDGTEDIYTLFTDDPAFAEDSAS
jgi:hypothetical protein